MAVVPQPWVLLDQETQQEALVDGWSSGMVSLGLSHDGRMLWADKWQLTPKLFGLNPTRLSGVLFHLWFPFLSKLSLIKGTFVHPS